MGIMCAICGLLMVALPVSVVATNFSIYYSYAKSMIKLPPKKKVKAGAEANNFLCTSTNDTSKDSSRKNGSSGKNNKVVPLNNTSSLSGAPVGPRGNKLPPIHKKNEKWERVRNAVERMKREGIIKPKKMDLATVVAALSSKGDWKAPSG